MNQKMARKMSPCFQEDKVGGSVFLLNNLNKFECDVLTSDLVVLEYE